MTDPSSRSEIATHGKFFVSQHKRFFFKAIRLEEISAAPLDFKDKLALRKRLEELKAGHASGIVLRLANAEVALDIAEQLGLSTIIELPVKCERLLDSSGFTEASALSARSVRLFGAHRGLLGYLLDVEVSWQWLKHRGINQVQKRLRKLIGAMKRLDSAALVAINHRPETRALLLPEEDLVYSRVPALTQFELKSYIVGLHNVAEARPVVIELEEPTPQQGDHVASAFASGAAGVVARPSVRPVTSDVSAVRKLSCAELLPFATLNGTCPPRPRETPMVSVVICAYNAERTMRRCLESLRKLDYPNYEVIVVDDGSRDRTAEISMDFPEFRLIRQSNRGLSIARNVGLHAARGEIVAYTDADCVVDPHWLTLMIGAMVDNRFDACGGPNYAPPEEGRIEACVAVSPGAPGHVLTDEDRAEHLVGCNMVFRKGVLTAIGGFDPQFTSAGDDVDICWRALEAGFTLGFCPSAFVWHFRRNTFKAYYLQQRGYGRAEAMLYFKYPERFNSLGQIRWRGRIPGLARTLPGGTQKKVVWAMGSRAFFQTIYEREQGLVKFLPQTLEWQLFWSLAAVGMRAGGLTMLPALAMLMLGPIWALNYAWQAQIERSHQSLSSRLIVAMLSYTGPLARALARYRLRLKGAWSAIKGVAPSPRQRPTIKWFDRAILLTYWTERWIPRENLLDRMFKLFTRAGHPVIVDRGWNDFDLEVRPDAWTRVEIKTADEEHESGRLKNHVLARVRFSRLTGVPLIAGVASSLGCAAFGLMNLALIIGEITSVAAAFALSEAVESGRLAYRTIEECATELDLTPLGKPTVAARRARVAVREPVADGSREMAPAASLIAENRPTD